MFDPGVHQALGLQRSRLYEGPVMLAVASPADPAQGYDLLWELGSQILAVGRVPVVLDAHAQESPLHAERFTGSQGLLQVLHDTSIVNIERGGASAEWLVMPAYQGLKTLQATATAGGPRLAISRLLAPFASSVVLLMYAPALSLAPFLRGMRATGAIPVQPSAESGLSAYGAVKVLVQAGVTPVLLPAADIRGGKGASARLAKVVRNVGECAERHLSLPVAVWPRESWGYLAVDGATGASMNWGESEAEIHSLALEKFGVGGPTYWS